MTLLFLVIPDLYGVALPIAEALTFGTIGGGLLQKGSSLLLENENKTEVLLSDSSSKEMTPQEKK